MPVIWPTRNRASTGCLWSYGTLSPIHAIDSGIIDAIDAPASARETSRTVKVGAQAQRAEATDAQQHAKRMTLSFPKWSPEGPNTICRQP